MFSKKKQEGASPQEPTYAISNSFAVIKNLLRTKRITTAMRIATRRW